METPWEQPPLDPAPELVHERGPELQYVRVRFGVTFSCPDRAQRFARAFRVAFSRSASTVIGDTAWSAFRCGALDAHEASLQAAAAIRIIGAHKLVREQPRAAHLHDFEVLGTVLAHEFPRVARERDEALRKAMQWGLLHHPLVESAAAAQLVGRLTLPDRHAAGQREDGGGRAAVGDRPVAGGRAVAGERAVAHRAA